MAPVVRFRAGQELLFNTAKHAGVKSVRVAIENAKSAERLKAIFAIACEQTDCKNKFSEISRLLACYLISM